MAVSILQSMANDCTMAEELLQSMANDTSHRPFLFLRFLVSEIMGLDAAICVNTLLSRTRVCEVLSTCLPFSTSTYFGHDVPVYVKVLFWGVPAKMLLSLGLISSGSCTGFDYED